MDLTLTSALGFTLLVFILLFGLVFLMNYAGKDICFYKSKKNFHQINLFNWSSPEWGDKFKDYYYHFGPYLRVSRKLTTASCWKGCCSWVEIKK